MTPQIPGQLTYLSPEEWRHVVRCGIIPTSVAPAYHKEEPPPKSSREFDPTSALVPWWGVFFIGFFAGAFVTMPLWLF